MGQKFLSQDKGTTGQAQNLAKGRDGLGQPKFGTGWGQDSKNPGRDAGQNADRAEKDVLKQKNDVLKQKTMFYNRKGCSKTGFVPGHLLLPLSWDKGTPGQDFFLSRDKGTTGRPVPWKP